MEVALYVVVALLVCDGDLVNLDVVVRTVIVKVVVVHLLDVSVLSSAPLRCCCGARSLR